MSIDEDETKATLQALAKTGVNMQKPRTFDFFVAIPSEEAGEAVAAEAEKLGFAVSIELDEADSEDEEDQLTCYCSKEIVPELQTVIQLERALDAIAKAHGGYADGFGSMAD